VDATVKVTNTGDRTGKQVIQIYASRPDSAIDRPVRWLVGFAVAKAAAGETTTATVRIPARAFADWSEGGGGWHYEAGAFTLQAGTSVSDLPLSAVVTVA
jgi:beta-glucosidase